MTDTVRTTPPPAPSPAAGPLHDRLLALRRDLADAEAHFGDVLRALPEERRESARNLLHYLALRSRDLRELQDLLTRAGLSSLGRSEPHVLWSIDAVLGHTARAAGTDAHGAGRLAAGLPPEAAWATIERNTVALLGPKPASRGVRIMVTMPSEAADDPALVHDLVDAGMDCMRINCAHDDRAAWEAMIQHLRRAEEALGRSCTLLMDLPGPRVRTGPLEPGLEVVAIKPKRDDLGRVVEPAAVWLTPAEAPEPATDGADATLPLPTAFLARLQVGDRLDFEDASGAPRAMTIERLEGASRVAHLADTAHVTSGIPVRLAGRDGEAAVVGRLPARAQKIELDRGDRLLLTRGDAPGQPARRDPATGETLPGRIGCLPAEALDHVKPGERIWFDDGRIGGVIESVGEEGVWVAITGTRPGGDKLRPEKGINLPDSDLQLPPLSANDLELLPFIAEHADLVGYSFVGTPEDVRQLRQALADAGGEELGIVLKIERELAFRRLPDLLLEGLETPRLGVMIARGDLAVECGFARMAEVQEEILWLCAAAHVPVIWATQVMDQLAKQGRPSRAEVTDAAMGGRAECVMLNKGPHITDAVRALISILGRMQDHQQKKRDMLRRLEVAHHFLEEPRDLPPV